LAELGHGTAGHFDTPLKTAILSLPQGSGKNLIAAQLARSLGCLTVVDEWAPCDQITAGALHLTNADVLGGAA